MTAPLQQFHGVSTLPAFVFKYGHFSILDDPKPAQDRSFCRSDSLPPYCGTGAHEFGYATP